MTRAGGTRDLRALADNAALTLDVGWGDVLLTVLEVRRIDLDGVRPQRICARCEVAVPGRAARLARWLLNRRRAEARSERLAYREDVKGRSRNVVRR